MREENSRAVSLVMFEVRPSPIHGNGIFAGQAFAPGEFLLEYCGRRVRLSGMGEVDAGVPLGTLALAEPGWALDGSVRHNLARWVNHNCNPNCELIWEAGKLRVVSKKWLDPGDELTINYGYTAEESLSRPCHCGSAVCSGYQVGEPWRPALYRHLARRNHRARARA